MSPALKIDDLASVAPSDSISQAGSKDERRERRSDEKRSAKSSSRSGHVSRRSRSQRRDRRERESGGGEGEKEKSVFSLPIRGSERETGKKRSVVSHILGR